MRIILIISGYINIMHPVLSKQYAPIDSLYKAHHGWLYGWLRKKLGCAHHAADIAQDTFVRILTSRDAVLDMQTPRAYLTTTAQRLLIDRARRQAIEQSYLAELSLVAPENFHSPEQTQQILQALEQVSVALACLSDKAREAFLRHYLEGESHAEIALQLGVSTRMVRNYLVQALIQCQHVQTHLAY